ncbi:MAG: transglutaminase domain-containing protein [Clostridia bacterium]|nr:transglutaminase domain-containing protein [Clostridia bacterium]
MTINLSYLGYPLPNDIAMLEASGHFEEMNRLIDLMLQKSNTPSALRKRLEFARVCAEDTLNAYRLTEDEAFAGAKSSIPDLTRAEFNQLTDDRTLDWRLIDGVRHYRNNCLSNLLRTRSEYAVREKGLAVQMEHDAETHALDEIIQDIQKNGSAAMHMEMQECIEISSSRLTPGEPLRIWLPLPVQGKPVVHAEILGMSHQPVSIAPETAPQRTAYFELPYSDGMKVTVDLAWDTEMHYKKPDPALATADLPAEDVKDEDLAEIEPHVVFKPYLRALTQEIIGSTDNPLIKARRIYDFITTQCTYRFMPSYRSIPDIVGHFCSNLRGDCGVQALTFITMCRCCGIPARWQSGLYTAPVSSGMHDWAMFYVAPYGWMFADCSFGGSAYRTGSTMRHDFYFGHLDPWRLPFASGFQAEFIPPMSFMRYDPYDNQVGEAEAVSGRLLADEIDHSHRLITCMRRD